MRILRAKALKLLHRCLYLHIILSAHTHNETHTHSHTYSACLRHKLIDCINYNYVKNMHKDISTLIYLYCICIITENTASIYRNPTDFIKWIRCWSDTLKEDKDILLKFLTWEMYKTIFTEEINNVESQSTLTQRNETFVERIEQKLPQEISVIIAKIKPMSSTLANILQQMLDKAYKAAQ